MSLDNTRVGSSVPYVSPSSRLGYGQVEGAYLKLEVNRDAATNHLGRPRILPGMQDKKSDVRLDHEGDEANCRETISPEGAEQLNGRRHRVNSLDAPRHCASSDDRVCERIMKTATLQPLQYPVNRLCYLRMLQPSPRIRYCG